MLTQPRSLNSKRGPAHGGKGRAVQRRNVLVVCQAKKVNRALLPSWLCVVLLFVIGGIASCAALASIQPSYVPS